jgi:hypothetical protein
MGFLSGSKAAFEHSRIGMATKGSEFCTKQSLGMKNIARTTYEAVGSRLTLGLAAAAIGFALYQYAMEESGSVPVTEYMWDYSLITQEDLNMLARDLMEDD